jgi:hypothetical protein
VRGNAGSPPRCASRLARTRVFRPHRFRNTNSLASCRGGQKGTARKTVCGGTCQALIRRADTFILHCNYKIEFSAISTCSLICLLRHISHSRSESRNSISHSGYTFFRGSGEQVGRSYSAKQIEREHSISAHLVKRRYRDREAVQSLNFDLTGPRDLSWPRF